MNQGLDSSAENFGRLSFGVIAATLQYNQLRLFTRVQDMFYAVLQNGYRCTPVHVSGCLFNTKLTQTLTESIN